MWQSLSLGRKTINRPARGVNGITLVCTVFSRRARTTQQGLMVVPRAHLCLMQGVRSRGLVWVWRKCVASKESGASGRCRVAYQKWAHWNLESPYSRAHVPTSAPLSSQTAPSVKINYSDPTGQKNTPECMVCASFCFSWFGNLFLWSVSRKTYTLNQLHI